MSEKVHIRVGGVPEHFNLPWQRAAERDIFSSAGIDLSWTMYAGGTGAMTEALKNNSLDIGILLTEGFMAAACAGLKAKIAKVYIDTPLVWGIYTAADSGYDFARDIQHAPLAISRFGSGSHLMSMVHAHERKLNLTAEDFIAVHSLHGAVQSLKAHDTSFFYWEKFMTRPHVKSGELIQVGEFSAPWSSFLLVVSEASLRTKKDTILRLLKLMNLECIAFKQDNHSAIALSKRFDMSLPEARKWLAETQWNYDFSVDRRSLENARRALMTINLCNESLQIDQLMAPWMTIK
jgi:ABC-type nitrate/sulfonate/bicarbonate transport system substrate-binding protein